VPVRLKRDAVGRRPRAMTPMGRIPVRRSKRGSAWNAYRDAVKQGKMFPGSGMYCKPEADKRAQIVNYRCFVRVLAY
jgi:hypothetical protein